VLERMAPISRCNRIGCFCVILPNGYSVNSSLATTIAAPYYQIPLLLSNFCGYTCYCNLRLTIPGQVKFLLAILTAFFTSYHWLYLSINLIANCLFLSLVFALPTHESLLQSKLRLGKFASRSCTLLGSVLAFIVYALSNQTSSIAIFLVMIVLQILVALGMFLYGKYYLKPPPKFKKRRRARSRAKSLVRRIINI
jgi:hypothetical protein